VAAALPTRLPAVTACAQVSQDFAKALGLAIPPSILLRADEVIE
jgi:hypothetical protein